MKNWIAMMYWLLIFSVLLGGWIWDLQLPPSNATVIIACVLIFSVVMHMLSKDY